MTLEFDSQDALGNYYGPALDNVSVGPAMASPPIGGPVTSGPTPVTSGTPGTPTPAGCFSDRAAVDAALTMRWSTSMVEDHVNRVKLIKRQGYGRSSFALLRRRILAA
jgi:hypothetical protein